MLHYQKLLFVYKIIWIKFINQNYNKFLLDYFGLNKIKNLIDQKKYLPNLRKHDKSYVNGCNVYLVLKIVKYKSYNNL